MSDFSLIKEKQIQQLIKALNKDLKKENAGFRAISTFFGIMFISDFNFKFLNNVSLHFSDSFYKWSEEWFKDRGYKLRWSEDIIVSISKL